MRPTSFMPLRRAVSLSPSRPFAASPFPAAQTTQSPSQLKTDSHGSLHRDHMPLQRRHLSQASRLQCPGCRTACASSPSSNPAPKSQKKPSQPALTHYEFFPQTLTEGPPPHGRFAVDVRRLRAEFLQLQAHAHPDLQPPENKTRAQAMSARINEAYRTLIDPLMRANYLLSLRGVDIASDETAKVADTELLMLVLETREAIEEAESVEDLHGVSAENEERIAESTKILEDAFAADDLAAAKKEAIRLRYWVNIRQCLNDWEPGKPVSFAH
jgi:molecular chaperone HscB